MHRSHPQPHRYPYDFAESVISDFENKYARVMVFLARKLGLSPKEFRFRLIKCFMYNNRKWNVLREVMKNIHDQNIYDDLDTYSGKALVKYIQALRTFAEDRLIDKGLLNKTID